MGQWGVGGYVLQRLNTLLLQRPLTVEHWDFNDLPELQFFSLSMPVILKAQGTVF